ncbi:hypothetical protein [Pontibacter sp. G13]|uniref:hypothetical protein n=1 Tax=Pontibacter sp. G13 TaxID=3074898 RepID=UPI00288C33D0|nr:hypothetical protein [Pontibacter sp. G13]WNJ18810.1 hypothetical protein RJD25_28470 [Pontibacter sp. G13]
MKHLLLACCIWITGHSLVAQSVIRFPLQVPTTFQVQDVFRVEILGTVGSRRLKMEAYLTDNRGSLRMSWESPVIQAGSNALDYREIGLPPTPMQYGAQSAGGLDSLQTGVYQLCIFLLDGDTREELATACRNVHWYRQKAFSRLREGAEEVWDRRNSQFSIGGSFRLTGQYSTLPEPPGLSIGFPPPVTRYLRFEAAPRVTAFGIPLTAQIHYSTENEQFSYRMNRINLGLDRAALLSRLRAKAEAAIRAEEREILSHLGQDDRVRGLRDKHRKGSEWYQSLSSLREQELAQILGTADDRARGLGYGGWEELAGDSLLRQDLQMYRQYLNLRKVQNAPEYQALMDSCRAFRTRYPHADSTELAHFSDSLGQADPEALRYWHRQCRQCDHLDSLDTRYRELELLAGDLAPYLEIIEMAAKADSLDATSLAGMLANPGMLGKVGALSKAERIMSDIRTMQVGTVFPSYSSNTLDGIGVRGMDMVYAPGPWELGVTVGELMPMIWQLDSTEQDRPKPKVVAGKLGIRVRESLQVTGMAIWIDERPMPWNTGGPPVSGYLNTNLLAGLQANGSLGKDRIQISGNWFRSMLRPTLPDDATGSDTLRIPAPTDQSGNSWQIQMGVRPFPGNQLSATMTQSDASYASLGAPLLIQRNHKSLQLDQRFWQGRLGVGAHYREDLSPFDLPGPVRRSISQSAGGHVQFHPKSGLGFTLSYAPFFRTISPVDSVAQTEVSHSLISVQASHQWARGQLTGSGNVIWTRQIQSRDDTPGFISQMAGISQVLTWGQLGLTAAGSWIQTEFGGAQQDIRDLQVGMQGMTGNGWNLSAGWHYRAEFPRQAKSGIWLMAQMPFGKHVFLETSLRRFRHNPLSGDADWATTPEWMIQTSLNVRWK